LNTLSLCSSLIVRAIKLRVLCHTVSSMFSSWGNFQFDCILPC
jgi:hypothetical protein